MRASGRSSSRIGSHLRTFPSGDRAFAAHVRRIAETDPTDGPAAFEARLRRFFPKAIVRRRDLSGEPEFWYVYRDRDWARAEETWWQGDHVGRLRVSLEGWLLEANGVARGLLGLGADGPDQHHFTDFVAPGTLRDAEEIHAIVSAGDPFRGTVLVRPLHGHTLAIDLNARRDGDLIVAELRLARDVPEVQQVTVPRPASLECRPTGDVAFERYASTLLERMPEPTVDGLALRLRRLYPHAEVRAGEDGWVAERGAGETAPEPGWWERPGLPRVTFDAQGLIHDANPAAQQLLGSPLIGHHWHELVTTGTTDAVDDMIGIIRMAGGAVSRFRMPDATGSLVEFDTFTSVDEQDDLLVTIMRPLP